MNLSKDDSMLYSGIRESCCGIIFEYTCHDFMSRRLRSIESGIKISLIVFSALAFASVLTALILLPNVLGSFISLIVCVVFSILTFAFAICAKTYSSSKIAEEHRKTAVSLKEIKEEYLSILTDFNSLEVDEIKIRRDAVFKKSSEIVSAAPELSKKALRKTRKSLNIKDERKITADEADRLLPKSLERISEKDE